MISCGWLVWCSCHTNGTMHVAPDTKKHWVEVPDKGVGVLYIDPVPSEKLLRVKEGSNSKFISYRVGVRDERAITDGRAIREKTKYMQYRIQDDWKLMLQQDSVKPVFFQPSVKTEYHTDEGILVFEIPSGSVPDTLIYNDSYGTWGIQKIILKSH